MEDHLPDPLILRVKNSIELPIEIKAHILSFFNNQTELLRAGSISKNWRQAAEIVWKNKPLNLSKRRLNKEDYEAFIYGPFSYLILKSVQLGNEEVCILSLSSRFNHLDLDNNSIGDEGAKELASGNLSSLTKLYLDCNNIGAIGAKELASGNLSGLITLYLYNNSIGDEGVKELASGNLSSLTKLDLRYNSIGDEGVKELASGNLSGLITLYLKHNRIGDEGVKGLVSGNLSSLTKLYLQHNSIDEGAKGLSSTKLPALTWF